MIGLHIQTPQPDWNRTLNRFPDGTWIKAVDNVQLLDEAKRQHPGIKTVLRHWYDGDQIFGTVDQLVLRNRAREFFNTFIDGTFAQFAHNVDAIEEWNEYNATSHTGQDLAERVAWCDAVSWVWTNEYRTAPKYAHIRLVLGNVAIGNNMPWQYAKFAYERDCLLGYHPYVPTARTSTLKIDEAVSFSTESQEWNGSANRPLFIHIPEYDNEQAVSFSTSDADGILPNEWPILSGRWATMDADFRSRGYYCQWLFTEFGPVGYGIGDTGGLWLKALDGWRHPDCLNADVQGYLNVMDYWLQQTSDWNSEHGNRALGAVLFTTGGGAQWQHFETKQPEIDAISEHMGGWSVPPPIIPPPSPTIREYARTVHLLPQNATVDQVANVMRLAFDKKQSVVWSADDAVMNPDPEQARLTAKNVIVWGDAPGGDKDTWEQWVRDHYSPYPDSMVYRSFVEFEAFRFSHWPTEFRTGGLLGDGLNQMFGDNPENYEPLPGHDGIDFHTVTGSPIKAMAAGTVYRVHTDPLTHAYGIHIRIDHGNGYKTIYGHLSAAGVLVGDVVFGGMTIGYGGSTGNSTGPHLHLAMKQEGSTASGSSWPFDLIDPYPFMEEL